MSLVLNVEILGEFRKLTSATQGAQGELQGLNNKISGFAKSAGRAFASIGVGLSFAVIARELGEATKAAVEDRKSAGLLADQLEKTVGANDALIASVEKSISGLSRQAAIADDDLRPAMAQLTRVTKDTDEAQKLLKLATDISAGSGKDLTSVVTALSKAYQGKMTALTKLGVPMSESIQNASDYSKEMTKLGTLQREAAYAVEMYGEKSKEATKALEKVEAQQGKVNDIAARGIDWQNDLAEAFGGAAEKAANLDPYQKMQVIFGEIQEQVGVSLLPILDKFGTWLTSPKGEETLQKVTDVVVDMLEQFTAMATWAADNSDWLVPLATGISAVAGAWKLVTIAVNATKGAIVLATAAQAAFNAIGGGAGGAGAAGTAAKTTGQAVAKSLLPFALSAGVIGAGAAVGGFVTSQDKLANAKIIAGSKAGDPFGGAKEAFGYSAPSTTTNVTINNNTGTVTGSDIVATLNKWANNTGTQ